MGRQYNPEPMRRAVLIYNPVSGRGEKGRAQVEAAAAVLRAAGVEATLMPTSAPAAAAGLARDAIAAGADTVFACGGDGTIHEVLQGMVGSQAALGIVPLGTANSLAWDLRIPRNAAAAARVALHAVPRPVAICRVTYRDRNDRSDSRYFIMNAGIGLDALLFYRMNALSKRRFGMAAYYREALRQWLTARYEYFDCEFTTPAGEQRRERVTQAMAVRIADFGGLVGKLAPGADLRHDQMRLLLFTTARRGAFLHFTVRTLFGQGTRVRGVALADAIRARCAPISPGQRVYVEADGELLGVAPVEVEMARETVLILTPEQGDGRRGEPRSSRCQLADPE